MLPNTKITRISNVVKIVYILLLPTLGNEPFQLLFPGQRAEVLKVENLGRGIFPTKSMCVLTSTIWLAIELENPEEAVAQ
uniref:Uncharacterized protein n=1 Tax=Romanomermis culicivorax TaxID=13658 RepID=A0A915K9Y7_ROMCU